MESKKEKNIFEKKCYEAYKLHWMITHACTLKEMLHEINGHTSDNGQIGFSCNDGSIVAYDYGFEADSDDELCSDLHSYFDIYNTESLAKYLHALVKILGEEEDAMLALEESYGVHHDNDDDDCYQTDDDDNDCCQTQDEKDSYENTNEENSGIILFYQDNLLQI